MQSRAMEILVGFFVCIGLAAVFILTLRVASLDTIQGGSGYHVTAEFENTGSLKPGAAVTLSGVKIGRVRNIAINPKNFNAVVDFEISTLYSNIPDDSTVKILTAGLLGEQYLSVSVGGSDDNLKEGSKIRFTQSALVLENLIGQFLANQSAKPAETEK